MGRGLTPPGSEGEGRPSEGRGALKATPLPQTPHPCATGDHESVVQRGNDRGRRGSSPPSSR